MDGRKWNEAESPRAFLRTISRRCKEVPLTCICGLTVFFSFVHYICYGFCIIGVSIGAWSGFGLVFLCGSTLYILGLVHIALSIGFSTFLYLSILVHTMWLRSPLEVWMSHCMHIYRHGQIYSMHTTILPELIKPISQNEQNMNV